MVRVSHKLHAEETCHDMQIYRETFQGSMVACGKSCTVVLESRPVSSHICGSNGIFSFMLGMCTCKGQGGYDR